MLRANPNDQEALEALVRMDVAGGKGRAAAARVDARLKEAMPTVALLTLAAGAHEAAGDIDRAEALLRQAIELDPDRLTAYSRLGTLYVRRSACSKPSRISARSPRATRNPSPRAR